jgi:hypothetical protein
MRPDILIRILLFHMCVMRWCVAVVAVLAGSALAEPAAPVVISQIYGGGGNSGAPFTHDFVELHNISNSAQSLEGWTLQYAAASGTSWQNAPLSGSIPPGGYFLVQFGGGTAGIPLPAVDLTGPSIAMAAANGKVALVSSSIALTGSTGLPNPAIIDFVGYGTANSFEGTAAAPPGSNTLAVSRGDFGSIDTDDNSADFVAGAPAPRSGISAPYHPGGAEDLTAPEIVALNPVNGAIEVARHPTLTITFSEAVVAGSGAVMLKRRSDHSVVESFTLPSAEVTIAGATVTLHAAVSLDLEQVYYLEITSGAFEDVAGNPFVGFSGSGHWSFTAAGPDLIGPQVVSVTPENNSGGIDPAAALILNFDEEPAIGSGTILIKDAQSGHLVAELPVSDSSQVLAVARQVVVTPADPLPINTVFAVEVPAGAFVDASGNPSTAFGGVGVWEFSTPFSAELTASAPYLQEFEGFVSLETLPVGWSVVSTGTATSRNDYSGWYSGPPDTTAAGVKHSTATHSVFGYQHIASTGSVTQTLSLQNKTGAEITALTVSYLGRASRINEGRSPAYVVEVAGQVVPALSYSTTDGDRAPRAASVTGLSIAAGEFFKIVWTSDADQSPGSGSRKQIGISSVQVALGAGTFPPTVTAVVPDFGLLTSTSAVVASEVTGDGGSAITGRGFVYSATAFNPTPTIGGAGVTQVAAGEREVGGFQAELVNLPAGTEFSVRAYATNAQGTVYSSTLSLFTLMPPPAFSGSYSQSFNGFSGSIVDGGLPAGWSVSSTGGLNGFAGNWGSGNLSGGLLGNVSDPGVLGYQHVGTSGEVTFKLMLVNQTGFTLEQLHLSYLGRVARASENRSPTWTVFLDGVALPELAYSTAAGADELKSHVATGLSIPPGSTFTLTWVSSGTVGESGARRQIGVADVMISAEGSPAGHFATWLAKHGMSSEAASGDWDRDGISNLMEYALGLDPKASDRTPGSLVGNVLSFAKGAEAVANGDLVYRIETSTTLAPGSWSPAVDAVDAATTISLALPSGPGPVFARLAIMAAD